MDQRRWGVVLAVLLLLFFALFVPEALRTGGVTAVLLVVLGGSLAGGYSQHR